VHHNSFGARLAFAAFVALTVLTGGVARADEDGFISPRAAAHVGRIEGGRVAWQSSYIGNVSGAPADAPPRWERLQLQRPVAGVLDAARSPGVAADLQPDGTIRAFEVDTRALPRWRDEVTVVVTATLVVEGGEVVLSPPLALGTGVQRIEISGEEERRFEPESTDGFVHDVGSWSTQGISEQARHETDALLGGRDAPLDEMPLYVEATSPALVRGLRGRAPTAAERARPGMILAIAVFFLLAVGCLVAYRWLAGDARVEQAEATIREEFEREARGR
jgi:hypothetical protein